MIDKPVVLILAGGKGERLWPRSRLGFPKQLQKIYSGSTLLEETFRRAKSITDPELIYIGCNNALKKVIQRTHSVLKSNFIVEPEGRNTAPIIALSSLMFEKKYPGRTHVVLSADHFISPLSQFKKTIKSAIASAVYNKLVLLGIKPSRPETGYGYIAAGKKMASGHGREIHSFVEKPDLKKALNFINKKNYYWNSGIFIWKGAVILEEFRRHAPDILLPLENIFTKRNLLSNTFPKLPAIPVDIAIMEKSKKTAVVEASFIWDDVGSWPALSRIVPADKYGNIHVKEGGESNLMVKNASDNIVISSRKLIALLNIKDVVIVDDEDVLFISSREGVADIKELLLELRKNKDLQKYLR